MTAIDQFAVLISTAARACDSAAIDRSRAAFIDTLACMFAGSSRPLAHKTLHAVKHWGQGESPVVGQAVRLSPPFAAMVNGAAAHALDYDDFDEPANAHPSAVIFPGLLALAAERQSAGLDLLDAHIVGVEVMQRLGEAMNMKAYPCCGYTHRLLDAAIDLHARLPAGAADINSILISVPDYYLDLLVYPQPRNVDEAMFSAEYNVAAALTRGGFGLAELSDAAIADPELVRLGSLARVEARVPRDTDIVYDPLDPDFVEVMLADGSRLRSEIGLPTGSPKKPMEEAACRAKFDQCLEPLKTVAQRDDLWALLNCLEQQDDLAVRLEL